MSEEEIRQRVDAAVRAVKGRIADLAIERFREDFRKNLDAATQQKIIERNIDAMRRASMKESSLVKRYAKALVLAMDDEAEFQRVRGELHASWSCLPPTTG